ncbi:hypothetical protein KYG_03084 [Acidovorax sp. NO-1]|jgi:hypothetical protein|uniref:hypothetical protein n=1 Tax=Acidovorax sp. NO-1 TaxID=512030 RepID=UPI00023FCDF0|nr:hypothetical protein [Acidovorax sp. NO-1]EHL24404.1 hypothetical protein KYG_03084 [Acidovorax sp. NO-1]
MASDITPSHHSAPHRLNAPAAAAANQAFPLPQKRTKTTAAQLAPSAGTEQRGPFIPVTDWNLRHPWPPIGGLRHLIFHAASNGFDKVIRRVGRRVLIDEAAFFAWVDGNGGAK